MKVVLLTNIIPPYRVEFFRELSYLCDLTVVCDSLVCPLREWRLDPAGFGFDYIELQSEGELYTHKRPDAGFDEQRVRYKGIGVRKTLNKLRPDVVVTCEFGMRSLYTLLYCKQRGVPYLIWSEGTRFTEKMVGALKKLFRKLLARKAQGFWTNGTASRQYLEDLGANSTTIAEGMTGISTHAYRKAGEELSNAREALRVEYGVRGVCFLFVGSISERKGVRQLLEAIEDCDAKLEQEATFIIAGSGPLQEEAEAVGSRLKRLKLVFPGFQDQEGIQKLFAASDVFVMPTLDDNWPLVTIEAMVSGVPQIGSIYNGASADLAKKEEVGVFIDPFDVKSLAALLVERVKATPARLSVEMVDWATEFYSPQSQAKRASELISRIKK